MKVLRIDTVTDEVLAEVVKRPPVDLSQLATTVGEVLQRVKDEGDKAVVDYEERFDHVRLQSLAVTEEEMQEAESLVGEPLKKAIELAHGNISRFHAAQLQELPHV